jgi:hypothetical protein
LDDLIKEENAADGESKDACGSFVSYKMNNYDNFFDFLETTFKFSVKWQ